MRAVSVEERKRGEGEEKRGGGEFNERLLQVQHRRRPIEQTSLHPLEALEEQREASNPSLEIRPQWPIMYKAMSLGNVISETNTYRGSRLIGLQFLNVQVTDDIYRDGLKIGRRDKIERMVICLPFCWMVETVKPRTARERGA